MKEKYTVAEAQEFLPWAYSTLLRYCADGRIVAEKEENKSKKYPLGWRTRYWITHSEIERVLALVKSGEFRKTRAKETKPRQMKTLPQPKTGIYLPTSTEERRRLAAAVTPQRRLELLRKEADKVENE